MTNIENIFKNQIPFQDIYEYIDDDESRTFIYKTFIRKTLIYETMLIQDPQSMCLGNVDDIYRKVEPFIRYLISEHRAMEPKGSSHVHSFFGIGIYIRDDEEHFNFKTLLIFHADAISGVFKFHEPKYKEISYVSYTKPFEIHIDGYTDYLILEEEEEEEEEGEEEEEPPKPLEESFRTETCIIYLDKEPNILFTDCNHICMCLECVKIKSLVNCPYCRTKISKRIKN